MIDIACKFFCILENLSSSFPSREETELGEMDYDVIKKAIEEPRKKRSNSKYTELERYLIGKYAAVNGAAAAVRKFKKSHPHLKLGESMARHLWDKYRKEIKTNEGITKLTKSKVGRPLMLGVVDEQVKNFLIALCKKGGVVNKVVAIATARALISRSDDQCLKSIDLENTSWARSLFNRMGFVKRSATTSKPEIPELAVKEAKLTYQHQISKIIEDHSIPLSMVMNFDQTPLKYVPVASRTLCEKGTKHVSIYGATYRQAITATFGITYTNTFLPMQLIYGGKTERSYPPFKFPDSFSLSCNPKHFSNTQESLKLIDEIMIPYLETEREKLKLESDHRALLIIDVFSGQVTNPVLENLQENHIKLVRVPPNMTHLLQPLDLTVNGSAKSYLKRRFTEWFSGKISEELDAGKQLEQIEIKLHLSKLKPLHAKWLVDLYNYLTSVKGQEIIANGWKSAGITEAISLGPRGLPSLDPFAHVDPLDETMTLNDRVTTPDADFVNFVTPRESLLSDLEDEWEPEDKSQDEDGNKSESQDDNEHHSNIFEIIQDDDEY